ncbi:50S ribosomal protein L29 [Candidatus Pelagibacter communis]|uniref:50S ribosomal protein L29 n=1 Tax=Pelagibacter ubique TaxID=198252 RepID=UPI00094D8F5D|nr:50S ribosomal protein L29 [Candidatus Pelagibacter ubique]|tara:strand:- start:321 stop:512 length:192 start_codon:yes stop_codon:yes gene_type:complete
MKKSEFKKLTLDKAKKDLEKNKKDLFNLRFQKTNGQLTNTSKFNSTKKTIAKLLTFIDRKKNA